MTEHDLPAVFAATAAEVVADLKPPGLDDVRRRLARRRRRRSLAGATAVATVAAVAAALAIPVALSRSGEPGATNQPVAIPSASPSPSTLPQHTPTAVKGPGSAPAATPTTRPPSGHHTTSSHPPACVHRQYAEITSYSPDIVFNAKVNKYYSICPNETIRVFWAQYVFNPDGSQRLYSSHVAVLTFAHPTDSSPYPLVPGTECSGDQYEVTGGNFALAQTLPAGSHHPYPDFKDGKGGVVAWGPGYQSNCP